MVDEEDRSQRVRKSLAEAHLVEIAPDEFPDRIREVKQVAIGHLGELLKNDTGAGGAPIRGPLSRHLTQA